MIRPGARCPSHVRFASGTTSNWTGSYPVLYRLEGDVLSSREELDRALRDYDAGLYAGRFDAKKIKIDIGEARTEIRQGHNVARRSVTIDGFDPFVSRKALTTHLEVFRWWCPKSKRTLVLILRSPRPLREDDEVWKRLLPFWEEAECHTPRSQKPTNKERSTSEGHIP